MTIADDLLAAAIKLDSTIDRAAWDVATRLRAHADTIERVEREMIGSFNISGTVPRLKVKEWAHTLRGDKP